MKSEQLIEGQVKQLQLRLSTYQEQLSSSPDNPSLPLDLTLEELRVAQEEVTRQNRAAASVEIGACLS